MPLDLGGVFQLRVLRGEELAVIPPPTRLKIRRWVVPNLKPAKEVFGKGS